MKKMLSVLGIAVLSAAEAGQVRELSDILVVNSDIPQKVCTVNAVKLSDHTLRNAAGSGEKIDAAAFEGLSADIALSWNGEGLAISLRERDRCVTGDVVLKWEDVVTRVPLHNAKAFVPWRSLTSTRRTPEDVFCVFDLEWDGLSAEALRQMPRDVRRQSVHTSMAVLTAEPVFRFNPHLPNPGMWGKVLFAAEAKGVRVSAGSQVRDFSQIGCFRAERNVDGSLDDWRRDGFLKAALLPDELGGRYASEYALAFDDKFLYVASIVSHPNGKPVNSVSAESGAGYGGGDAMQLRVSPDGVSSRSFCAWLSPTGPAFTVDTENPSERNLLDRGAKLAFGKIDGAYTMELAVPWEILGARAQSGDEWRMTFQPWWNASGGRFAFFSRLKLARPPAKKVEIAIPKKGAVSLGVFEKDGTLVRTLLKSDWRDNCKLSEEWDLKDQWGRFVEPGEYLLKGLVSDGVKSRYLSSVCNPGTPPWPTSDGRGDWLSDEAPPQGMATDGTNVFVAAPGSEKGYAVMAIGPDGKRIWGVGEEFYPRCVSLSYWKGRLYALFSGPVKDSSSAERGGKAGAMSRAVIVAYDAKTGRHIDFSSKNARTELGERWPYREETKLFCDLISQKAFTPSNYIGQPRYFDRDIGETENAIGFAALQGLFAVSKLYEDKIELYDASTLEKRAEVGVVAPAGLCRVSSDEFLAVSGSRIVRIDSGRRVSCVIDCGLSAPVAVATDGSGDIYVSDWADEMCVKRFSPEGRFIGVIGKLGGRPWIGAFEKDGMLLPHGLAVTDGGTLYVAEADTLPKSISAWRAKDGRFLRHWIGPTPYGGMSSFWVDPDESGFFHAMGCKFSYDAKSGAWDIAATEVRCMDRRQMFLPNFSSCMGAGVKVVKRGGQTYICTGRCNETVWLRKKGDVFLPCAAVGGLHSMVTDDGTGQVLWDSDIGRHLYRNVRPEFFRGHSGKAGRAGDNYAWSDLNGDGVAQPDEMTWCETLTRGDPLSAMDPGGEKTGCQCEFYNAWGAVPSADGTLHFAGFAKDGDCIWRLKPDSWTKYGPVYDIGKALCVRREKGFDSQFSSLWTDEDGNVFVVGAMKDVRTLAARSSLMSLSRDGKVKWEIASPKSKDEKDVAGSGINGMWNIPGLGSVVCIWNWWWNLRPYFITADGLYVGTFGEETSLGPAALWDESAKYFFQTKDGIPCIVNGANQSAHIHAMEGLKNAKRFNGSVLISRSDIDRAKKRGAVAVRRAPPKAVINLNAQTIAASDGKGRGWRVSLFSPFGSDSLSVEADVDDSSPMVQPGTDFRTLFITGDAVDVMLATDPSAPRERRAAAVGDKRILFSEMNGKGVAVIYEPVLEPRALKPHRLMAAEIDSIRVLENAEVSIVRRRDGSGYKLVAHVPLSEIGLRAEDTRTLRGDVGVVFSGKTGGRVLRLYHYNKDTAQTSDLTTEATLQPHEWGLILRPHGKNLIKDPTFGTGSSPFLVSTADHVSIGETIELPEGCAGKVAKLRMLMRSTGLKPEDMTKKEKPGAYMLVWAFVKNVEGKVISQQILYRRETDVWDWTLSTRAARHDQLDGDDAISFTLPEGAASICLDFKLTVIGQPGPAKVWVDAVELTL